MAASFAKEKDPAWSLSSGGTLAGAYRSLVFTYIYDTL